MASFQKIHKSIFSPIMLKKYFFRETSLTQADLFLLVFGRYLASCVLICDFLTTHKVWKLLTHRCSILFQGVTVHVTDHCLFSIVLCFLLVIRSCSLYNPDINIINIVNPSSPDLHLPLNNLCYLFLFRFLYLTRPVYQYINLSSFIDLGFLFHYKLFLTPKIICACTCKIFYFLDVDRAFIFLLMLSSLIHLFFYCSMGYSLTNLQFMIAYNSFVSS